MLASRPRAPAPASERPAVHGPPAADAAGRRARGESRREPEDQNRNNQIDSKLHTIDSNEAQNQDHWS